jgi:hypothetical protein|eukprot:scaffold10549_cov271-Chaetoceros_neogracile.AAC.7
MVSRKSKRLKLAERENANKKNRWVLDMFESTVGWKRNGFQVHGDNADSAVVRKALCLQSRSAAQTLCRYGIHALFQMFSVSK